LDLDNIGSPFKRARASDASVDVSSARKASELFSKSLDQTAEAPVEASKTKKEGDLNISMDEEL
jgi:hypothetical protein